MGDRGERTWQGCDWLTQMLIFVSVPIKKGATIKT